MRSSNRTKHIYIHTEFLKQRMKLHLCQTSFCFPRAFHVDNLQLLHFCIPLKCLFPVPSNNLGSISVQRNIQGKQPWLKMLTTHMPLGILLKLHNYIFRMTSGLSFLLQHPWHPCLHCPLQFWLCKEKLWGMRTMQYETTHQVWSSRKAVLFCLLHC